MAYVDGRTVGRVGTSKARQTDGRADGQADGPNRAKIARSNVILVFAEMLPVTRQTGRLEVGCSCSRAVVQQ